MADKYYAGKSGSVGVTSDEYGANDTVAVKSWKATHSIQELDTTSTTSAGKYEVQGGIEKVEGTFEAQWVPGESPFASGYGFAAGTNVANLKLFANASNTSSGFVLPLAFVKSVDVEVSVDAVVKYTVSFSSNGPFTLPS